MILNKIENYKKTVKLSAQSIYLGHHKISYRGIEAIKCPFDYVIYQMILFEIKPDLVIEIGTNKGGSALFMADFMETIKHGLIHTIDIKDEADELAKKHPRIKIFKNGFENYDLNLTEDYKTILVIDDASHTYEQTLSALKKFESIVSLNSYFIVEDGIVDELKMAKRFNGGPLRAIKEFLKDNKNYIIDRKWCDLFGVNATFNVNGYLKKIKV